VSYAWPSREEWAARAEYFVRTVCLPLERVPEGAEHYLTVAEVAEMTGLYVELSKAVRAPLTTEIKRLQAVLPWPPPAKPLDRADWYDALADEQQRAWHQLQDLRTARLEIGRRAKGLTYNLTGWHRSPLAFSVLSTDVAPLVPDQAMLARLDELEARYATLRQQAAGEALESAIAREVAERNTDEGWAMELKRRARIDGGVHLITAGPADPAPDLTEETTNG
jgi:hypothetical protein